MTNYNGNLKASGHERTCKYDINLSNYTIKVYDEVGGGTVENEALTVQDLL